MIRLNLLGKCALIMIGAMLVNPQSLTAEDFQIDEGSEHETTIGSEAGQFRKKSTGYNIKIGMALPSFGSLKYYETLYGESQLYPHVGVNWMFHRSRVELGLGFGMGFYRVKGKAAKKPIVDNPNEGDITKDADSVALTLVPLDFIFASRVAIGSGETMALRAWLGYEDLYYQEVRLAVDSGSDSRRQMTSGWNGGFIIGASFDFSISQFDSRGARSMRSIGMKEVYISPFIEVVQKMGETSMLGKAGKVDFSRTNLGLSFVFEGV